MRIGTELTNLLTKKHLHDERMTIDDIRTTAGELDTGYYDSRFIEEDTLSLSPWARHARERQKKTQEHEQNKLRKMQQLGLIFEPSREIRFEEADEDEFDDPSGEEKDYGKRYTQTALDTHYYYWLKTRGC
ncbi:MAG TPA: hypothetical protein O0X70_06120 [Methanocorpusculum sp.]|nr:hypothetical protein [Methanocorpusculum sp.]